jgi:gluconolactonase
MTATMTATMLADGLGFPEGPVVMPDGQIVFCDGNTGEMLAWDGTAISTFAVTGGSPWGAVLGTDGAVYVCQGGNVPGSGDLSAVPGLQRIDPDGTVALPYVELAGLPLGGPNDLAWGPDGRLWFTDSEDHRLFVLAADGTGELIADLPGVYPNGIGFDPEGLLYWSESRTQRIGRLVDGQVETFCQLPEDHVPDGMAFSADGRLFVCNTTAGGLSVIAPSGEVVEELDISEHVTNCIFDGSTLYLTATKVSDIEASQRTGSLWKVETDASAGLLHTGQL